MFDIGSNSVRFVGYEGPARAPMPIYNEKWPISLGRIVRDSGRIDEASMAHLLRGIDRFTALAGYMDISDIRAVATAAVREAENGRDFVDAARARGLNIDLLGGAQEAEAAAHGVLCNYPDADGYVADLGGGSLELSRISDGKVQVIGSLPLGTTKLIELDEAGWRAADLGIRDVLGENVNAGCNFYMVGGTWRAVAHLHQHLTGYPIRILSHYEIAPDALGELAEECHDTQQNQSVEMIPDQRVSFMPGAARLLTLLNGILQPSRFVASALGIREGLLYEQLQPQLRLEDPLLAGARYRGSRLGRRSFNGDRLFAWMQNIFADSDQPGDVRLRHAACLLADSAWNIHPDYRSAHALQIGIEGNWLGASGSDRARIARALWSAYGDSNNDRALLSRLAKRADLRRADKWGLAIRLGMRIDGGTGAILPEAPINIDGDDLLLSLPAVMPGDSLTHRLGKLASGMGLKPRIA